MENWERDMIEGVNRHADEMAAKREAGIRDMLRIAEVLEREQKLKKLALVLACILIATATVAIAVTVV